jgi:sugar phosphate permease
MMMLLLLLFLILFFFPNFIFWIFNNQSASTAALCDADEKKPSMIQNLKTEVLTNPYVWLFAISYFFVYVIRQGATSWLIFYLKVTTSQCP